MIEIYEQAQDALELAPDADDSAIADVIIQRATGLYASGQTLDVDHCLGVLQGHRGSSHDSYRAVMMCALHELRHEGIPIREAQAILEQRYPAHGIAVLEACALARMMLTSADEAAMVRGTPRLMLPIDCGARCDGIDLPRYQATQESGRGSYGLVCRGVDRLLNSDDRPAEVAIKFVHRATESSHGVLNEAVKARRVDHPGVVSVHDCGVMPDLDLEYGVFDWVGGGTLHDFVIERKALRPRHATELVAAIAEAVHAIHASGLIHRDLKPSNILMTEGGEPRVTDVGGSRLINESNGSGNGPSAGSLAFMAPEQLVSSATITTATDVFALGSILIWCITGRPLAGLTEAEVRRFHASRASGGGRDETAELLPAGDLGRVIQRAIAPHPEDRYPSADSLAVDLRRCMEHESIGWTKPSVVHRARLFLRRKPLLAGVLGVLVLAVIAASVAFHSYRIRDTRVHAYESSGHDYAMSLIRHLEAQRQANAHADRMITMTLALDLLVRSGFLGDVLSEDLTSEELLKITRFEYELAPENTVTRGLWGLMRSALALTVNEYEAQDIEDARALRLELEGYLPIHDPLLRQAEALIHAHSAKSLYFLTEQGRPLSKAGIEYAAHTAEQLENLLEDLDDAFGSTILKGALRSLEMLYSSKMLDDAECANHYKDLREGMTAPLGGRFNLSPQSDP